MCEYTVLIKTGFIHVKIPIVYLKPIWTYNSTSKKNNTFFKEERYYCFSSNGTFGGFASRVCVCTGCDLKIFTILQNFH